MAAMLVDEKTGTIRLRATFDNNNRSLWPGQFVEAMLTLDKLEDALLVPARAIQTGRDEAFVYVVEDDGLAHYRKVEALFENEVKTAIKGDLRPGQKVVEGQLRLTPESPVTILN